MVPDTFVGMCVGYSVVFVLLAGWILNLAARIRKLEHTLKDGK